MSVSGEAGGQDPGGQGAGAPPAPVVGMVGAGQLARMTSAAAVGLGIRFRVLAAAPDESAAQVCAGTVLGDYRRAGLGPRRLRRVSVSGEAGGQDPGGQHPGGQDPGGQGAGAPPAPVVGMVGAGQLARMTSAAAVGLGIRFRVLAAAPDESAAQVCAGTVLGDYRRAADLLEFAVGCDVVTFDHEHVPGDLVAAVERAGTAVRPGSRALRYTQDKLAMRQAMVALGIGCPRFAAVSDLADVTAFAEQAGWPVVLKAISGGYDGKGVWVCQTPQEAAAVLGHGLDLIAEEHVPFVRELAVLVARAPSKQGAAYPVVQTVQRDGVCREVIAPAPWLDPDLAVAAEHLGLRIAAELDVTGLLAVELFQTDSGLLVNELAMRPHNSGHWSIEGSVTSQFEQHLRAVLNLPLGATTATAPFAVMVNVLGGPDPDLRSRLTHVMAADPGVKIHLYGKPARPGRKVGHVTVLGDDPDELAKRARAAASYLALGVEEA